MPIIKSAKKRVRVTAKATERNRGTRNALRSTFKNFVASVKGAKSTTAHADAQRALDMAVKKGVIHKNKAARKKAQLAKAMKAAGSKVEKSSKVKTTPKTAVKKAAPAKKVAPKKTTAKKPATKK
jgi:small subunit ribosomal protein S20